MRDCTATLTVALVFHIDNLNKGTVSSLVMCCKTLVRSSLGRIGTRKFCSGEQRVSRSRIIGTRSLTWIWESPMILYP